MKTVLSTKILTLPQKELLLNAGIGLVEYNALEIDFINFELPKDFNHIIVTSKNGAKAFLNVFKATKEKRPKEGYRLYCVGEKTRTFLQEFGFKVIQSSLNSSELGMYISNNHKTDKFIFISGNLRREELPLQLSKNNVRYEEIEGYRTTFKKKKFSGFFDGFLFFSPSGIRSFANENTIPKSPIFCIGETTASEAKKYSPYIVVAHRPTVENVLVHVVKHFKEHA